MIQPAAAAGVRLDRILITEPDRLARNYVHQVLLAEELQKHGAEVVFLDRPMGQDPHDQLLLQRHRSLIAGWVVKPSVQRLSGDGCPCRVMVLSAVGVSRRMMVSEAPAS